MGVIDLDGPDYWDYFGSRLIAHADVPEGAWVLDVGCGTGASLFPTSEIIGQRGHVIGIDICPG